MTKKRIKELENLVRDARIAELEAQLAMAKRDSERLDWLERESDLESLGRLVKGELVRYRALFRRNMLITRATIDDAGSRSHDAR